MFAFSKGVRHAFIFFLSFFFCALFKAWSSDCSIHLLKVFFFLKLRNSIALFSGTPAQQKRYKLL